MTDEEFENEFVPKSSLEALPQHVRAIGMIAVEITNLEIALGGLLAALLHIRESVGHIVFSTPQTAFGRLKIIENVVKNQMLEGSPGRTKVENLLERVRSLIGKRHSYIHSAWAINNDDLALLRRETPIFAEGPKEKVVSLEELEMVIDQIRTAGRDVEILVITMNAQWPPYTWNDKYGARPVR